MGTIVLTVAPNPIIEDGQGMGIPKAAVYSSGPVDLGNLPRGLPLHGPAIGFGGELIGERIKTTFDLKITFESASTSQPTIDVTGSLAGAVASEPGHSFAWFQGTATSATIQGWTPESGVPLALTNQYLDPSRYQLIQLITANAPPDSADFGLTVTPSAGAIVPEPATLLLYLAAMAVLGVWRGARPWQTHLLH